MSRRMLLREWTARLSRSVSSFDRGNTDCKMYYNLTKNIYRFMGGPFGLSAGVVSFETETRFQGSKFQANVLSTLSTSEVRSKPTTLSWASSSR